MEAVAAVASIIAIVQIAESIIGTCKAYIRDVKDAPSDLRTILIEVGSVKCVLEALELSISSEDESQEESHLLRKLGGGGGPLEGCKEALGALEKFFPSQPQPPPRGKRQRVALSLATLAWHFRKEKAKRLLEDISTHKATISLTLAAESRELVKHIRGDVEHIRSTTDDGELKQVLEWLVTTDPSPNHNNACELHEDHTGEWLINSPEYGGWIERRNRFLWLHGIPGAGKTVLASYIFQRVEALAEDSAPDVPGHAYYYCYFSRGQEESPHFLRWVISQLCRQIHQIPPKLDQIFRKGGQPSTSQLMDVLAAVVQKFPCIYLVIDALDESSEREKLTKLLLKINEDERFERLQILATSRKEVDIERILLKRTTNISLSNSYVDDDIELYIRGRLREDAKLDQLPEELKVEIMIALIEGAKGMFRWVVCQLDILKRLNSVANIRAALSDLPETLDETYERVLCTIPPECQKVAYKTLQLLAGGYVTTLDELAGALSVDEASLCFDLENRPLDVYGPIEHCACLIAHAVGHDAGRYDGEDDYREIVTIGLAHYTVKEFLTSDRIANSPASSFQMSDDTMNFLAATCFVVYLLEGDYLHDRRAITDREESMFFSAVSRWQRAIWGIESESSKGILAILLLKLFDPYRSHYHKFMRLLAFHQNGASHGEINLYPFWDAHAGAEGCVTLAHLCRYGYFEAATALLEQTSQKFPFESHLYRNTNFWYDKVTFVRGSGHFVRNRSPEDQKYYFANIAILTTRGMGSETDTLTILHIAASFRKANFLELLISKGADVNVKSVTGLSVLASALGGDVNDVYDQTEHDQIQEEILRVIDILLKNEANPNLPGAFVSPMQMHLIQCSTERSFWGPSYPITAKLLAYGCDVNSVADDEANITRIRRNCAFMFRHYRLKDREQEYIDNAVYCRGRSELYDTPLRIVQNRIKSIRRHPRIESAQKLEMLTCIEKLLQGYGGKSLHLFAVEGLPGFVQEDIEEMYGGGVNLEN